MSDLAFITAAFEIVDQPVVVTKKEKIVFMNKGAIFLAERNMTGLSASFLLPSYIVNTQAPSFAASAFIGNSSCTVNVRAYESYKVYTMILKKPQSNPLLLPGTNIRTILGNIKFAIDRITLMSEDIGNENLNDCISLTNRNYYKLKHIMDNIGMMNSFNDGSVVFKPTAINITELCKKLINTVTEMFSPTPVSITLNAEKDLHIFADEQLLETLIINLISNSIMNCGKDGKIKISLLKTERSLILSVDDNGAGFAPEELPLVFERYKYGVDLTKPQGAGLGLTIVRGIAELHDGTVIIESRGEGKGASVRVTLSTEIPHNLRLSASRLFKSNPLQTILTQMSDCLPLECFSAKASD